MSATRNARLADVGTYAAYVVICIFFAGPLLWLVSLSIRTSAEVYVSEIRLWPNAPTLENYQGRALRTRCSSPTSGTA